MPFTLKLNVPRAFGDTGDPALPVSATPMPVTGYTSFIVPPNGQTVYVLYQEEGTPTRQDVLDGGVPCVEEVPVSIQDPNGNPIPDLQYFYVAYLGSVLTPSTSPIHVIG